MYQSIEVTPYVVNVVESIKQSMDTNQLGRRNLSPVDFKLALGRRYNRTKKAQGTNNQHVQAQSEKDQNDTFQNTAAKLATQHGVSFTRRNALTNRNALTGHRGAMAGQFFDTAHLYMDITDQQAFADWQQKEFADEDESAPIDKPAHPLDAKTLTAMLLLLIPPMNESGKLTSGQVKFACRRLFVLAAICLQDVGACGFAVIADALTNAGIATTRACLSAAYVQIAEITGSTVLGRSAQAREVYSRSAKQVWAMRDRKPRTDSRKGSQEQA